MGVDPVLIQIHRSIRDSGRHPVLSGQNMPMPDRLRYQLCRGAQLNHRVDWTLKILKDAFEIAPPEQWCISISFGKDSVVLWDIITRQWSGIVSLFVNRSEEAEMPETPLLIAALQAYRNFALVEVKPDVTLFSLYDRLGGIPGISGNVSESIIRKETLAPPSDQWQRANNRIGHFMGRRIDENFKTRGVHLRSRGPLHFNQSNQLWSCDPLANWTAADIWAYIVKYDLPYHPVYDLESDRERARMSSWAGSAGARQGRWVLLKRHYRELWNYFCQRYPEASAYV